MHIKISFSAPGPWPHANLLNSCFRNSHLSKMAQRRKVNLVFCRCPERQVTALPLATALLGSLPSGERLDEVSQQVRGASQTHGLGSLGACEVAGSIRAAHKPLWELNTAPLPGASALQQGMVCVPAPHTRLPRLILHGAGHGLLNGVGENLEVDGAKETATPDGSSLVLHLHICLQRQAWPSLSGQEASPGWWPRPALHFLRPSPPELSSPAITQVTPVLSDRCCPARGSAGHSP